MSTPVDSRLALVTGAVGAGKTSAMERLAVLAGRSGLICGGILAPAVVEGGRKTGMRARDLRSGETRLLGRRTRRGYAFEADAFAWANAVLECELEGGADLLLLDEVGPLELDRGGGHAPVLPGLLGGVAPRTVLVVRASLLESLRSRARVSEVRTFPVGVSSREGVPAAVLAWLVD